MQKEKLSPSVCLLDLWFSFAPNATVAKASKSKGAETQSSCYDSSFPLGPLSKKKTSPYGSRDRRLVPWGNCSLSLSFVHRHPLSFHSVFTPTFHPFLCRTTDDTSTTGNLACRFLSRLPLPPKATTTSFLREWLLHSCMIDMLLPCHWGADLEVWLFASASICLASVHFLKFRFPTYFQLLFVHFVSFPLIFTVAPPLGRYKVSNVILQILLLTCYFAVAE